MNGRLGMTLKISKSLALEIINKRKSDKIYATRIASLKEYIDALPNEYLSNDDLYYIYNETLEPYSSHEGYWGLSYSLNTLNVIFTDFYERLNPFSFPTDIHPYMDLKESKLFTRENFECLLNIDDSGDHGKVLEVIHLLGGGKKNILTQKIFNLLIKNSKNRKIVSSIGDVILILEEYNLLSDQYLDLYACLTSETLETLFNEISSEYLTKELLNDLFFAAKNNKTEWLKSDLEYIASLSKATNELIALKQAIDSSNELHHQYHSSLVAKPIFYVTDLCKTIFSWTLGFNWLLRLERKLNLPRKYILLPQISFRIPDEYPVNLKNVGVEFTFAPYSISPLNFPFVGLNYLSRNLGKLIGFTLLLPWTLPVTLINQAVLNIKKIKLKSKVKNTISQMINSDKGSDLICRLLKFSSMDKSIKDFSGEIINSASEDDVCLAVQQRAFQILDEAKNSTNPVESIQSEISKLLSGIGSKSKRKGAEEKFKTARERLKPIENALEILAHSKKSRYEVGLSFLHSPSSTQNNIEAAYFFLSKVASNDPDFSNAMAECGNILFSKKLYDDANKFFEKAGSNSTTMAYVTSELAKGNTVSMSGLSKRGVSSSSSVNTSGISTSLDKSKDNTSQIKLFRNPLTKSNNAYEELLSSKRITFPKKNGR